MGRVNCFPSVSPVNAESFYRRFRMVSQVLDSNCCCMGSQHIAFCKFSIPDSAPAAGVNLSSALVHCSNFFEVFSRELAGAAQVESVLHISCRVVLRLEKGIEIPERTLNDPTFNLGKAHFQEDLTHLLYKTPVWMDLGSIEGFWSNIKTVRPELFLFPVPALQ